MITEEMDSKVQSLTHTNLSRLGPRFRGEGPQILDDYFHIWFTWQCV